MSQDLNRYDDWTNKASVQEELDALRGALADGQDILEKLRRTTNSTTNHTWDNSHDAFSSTDIIHELRLTKVAEGDRIVRMPAF